jgi:hypothetical protein
MKFKRKLVTLILLSTMITSMLSLLAPARAYKVDETSVCFGYDESTLAPEGISTTYLTTSEYVGFWANITSAPTNIHIMWKDPDQNQYQSNLVTVVQKTGKTWGIVFNKIQIAGTAMTSPSNHASVSGPTKQVFESTVRLPSAPIKHNIVSTII